MRAALLVVVGWLALPGAAGFPGQDWTAHGLAVVDGLAVPASVHWDAAAQRFSVAAGALALSFAGGEHWSPACCVGAGLYHAYSADPSVDFELTGAQSLQVQGAGAAPLAGRVNGAPLWLALAA
ncbi:MAG TPA: hypothetical protein VGR28_15145 [Candidatus Thermoplasmatota archaeon]|nr:hypothetical protein [Candidatus Thermoplasmatota archaeon]